jgi:hypothetical protein
MTPGIKRIMIAGVMATVTIAPAHSQTISPKPAFKDMNGFTVSCESNYNDRSHLTLEIVPNENSVKMISWKGEFTFPIVSPMIDQIKISNEYGHYTWSWYIYGVIFKDNGGKQRFLTIRRETGRYLYMGTYPESWSYSCIPAY